MSLAQASSERPAFRARRAAWRAERRARALARAKTPLSPQAIPDPLARERGRQRPVVAWLLASLAAHAVLGLVAVVVPASAPREKEAPLKVEFVEVEPPKPPEPPPPPPERPPAPPEPPPVVHQIVHPPPRPHPVPKPAIAEAPSPEPTPPTPVPEPQPSPAPPSPAPRRVVGLSMESTVASGGPAFAVGNTRMGETGRTAEDANDLGPAGGGSGDIVLPKRTSAPDPAYPSALKSQGLEGEVELEVRVGADGAVREVKVARPSAHEAFDEAAMEAARHSTYEPARLGGAAIEYAIRFTVRFRLKEGRP